MSDVIHTVVQRALVGRIEILEKELGDARRDLDDALSVIERMEKHLDDESKTGAWLDFRCMSLDHQLYDDILSLPARKKETP